MMIRNLPIGYKMLSYGYLVEVLNLVSPCKPELREAMDEEYERFAGVP